jgi:hypothetical protein
LKALARKPVQLEFDFFGGGNVSLGHQYIDAIQTRLLETDATPANRHLALATLTMIIITPRIHEKLNEPITRFTMDLQTDASPFA